MRTAVVATVVAVGVAASAGRASADDADPEFPLGPFVRAGRPLVVRVPGAMRVRGEGTPWALPQGARGDEFVLQGPRLDVTLRSLEVDRGEGAERIQISLRALSPDGVVHASFDRASGADVLLTSGDSLPTVREAWLLVDVVDAAPAQLPPEVRRALDAWRAGARRVSPGADGGGGSLEPLTFAPGPEAFRAAAEAESGASVLPRDVATALTLLAVAELLLLGLLRGRTPAARAVWLAAPPLACALWLAGSGRLPGPVRATLVQVLAPGERMHVLRLEARRDAEVSFRVPDGATTPAILRFDSGDHAAAGDEVGREVRCRLPAGHVRVVAWTDGRAGGRSGPPAEPGAAALAWLRSLRLAPVDRPPSGDDSPAGDDAPALFDVRGFRPVDALSLDVLGAPKRK